MGTKVQCKSYLPEYYPMRNLNEDSNGSSWPLYYGDKTSTNGQYYNGFLLRAVADGYSGYEKDAVKQKMLEHEAIFKSQVYELHRLYRKQRDLMDEIRRKDLHKRNMCAETPFSSSPLASQLPSEDARKWHIPGFPLVNSMHTRPSVCSAEDSHSHLSPVKGKSPQAGLAPSQNGGSSKDCEVLESRPTKVRRKMFDLQLPADEYIDTDEVEQFGDEKGSEISSLLATGCCKAEADNDEKLFIGSCEKPGYQGDASKSDACLRSRNGLADLNEPVQVEETNNSASFDLPGNASSKRENQGQTKFLGLPSETLQKFYQGRDNGTISHVQNQGNGREWMSYMLEAGHSKSNLASSQGLQPEKLLIPSQPLQAMLDKAHEPSTFLQTDQSKGEVWRDRTLYGSKISERSNDLFNYNHLEPVMTPNSTSPYQFVPSSDLAKSWSHSASSWEKPISSLSHQSASVQTFPYSNLSAILSSSQSLAQGPGIFGEKWHINGNSRSNSGFGSEVSNRNGFYRGSSSGSKEQPIYFSSGFDYLNCRNDCNAASENILNHSSTKYFRGSNHVDVNCSKDVKWDVALPNSSSNSAVPHHSLETTNGEKKHGDCLEVLPWLQTRPACKNEAAYARRDLDMMESSFSQAASNQLPNKVETSKVLTKSFAQILTSASHACVVSKEIDTSDCPSTKRILGFPVFEKPHISSNESSSLKSPSGSLFPSIGEDIGNQEKSEVLDINLPCDPVVSDSGKAVAEEVVEKPADIKLASVRNYIDLNSCISEDEALSTPLIPSSDVKAAREIDLEVPLAPDSQEQQHETITQSPQQEAKYQQEELAKIAAEAIVAISSSAFCNKLESASCNSSEEASMDPLGWFVEVVSSCACDLESKSVAVLRGRDGEDNGESSSNGIDYFETMTLKLKEMNAEEYTAKPFFPEYLNVEETGTNLLTNRPGKGQGRRGRQRRDFQRDILPGLASLSRHEVTEDLQTFGGLMRATGHPWQSGLTRRTATRNGYGRGRRRPVVVAPAVAVSPPVCTPLILQLNNIEVGLEDRSLTGWGKTTRRPRRQRCPAGNPPSLALT